MIRSPLGPPPGAPKSRAARPITLTRTNNKNTKGPENENFDKNYGRERLNKIYNRETENMKKFDWVFILSTSGEFYLQMNTSKT